MTKATPNICPQTCTTSETDRLSKSLTKLHWRLTGYVPLFVNNNNVNRVGRNPVHNQIPERGVYFTLNLTFGVLFLRQNK